MKPTEPLLLVPLLLLACGAPPSAQPPLPINTTCQSASTVGVAAPSASGFAVQSSAAAPGCEGGKCEPIDPCMRKVCEKNGACESRPLLNGTSCTPLEEYVEGDSHCYAGQCLSKRMCAKACLFDLVVELKPEMDPMLTECFDRSGGKSPKAYEECVSVKLEPRTKLAKLANRRIHECLVTCGYPPMMRDEDIEAYEKR